MLTCSKGTVRAPSHIGGRHDRKQRNGYQRTGTAIAGNHPRVVRFKRLSFADRIPKWNVLGDALAVAAQRACGDGLRCGFQCGLGQDHSAVGSKGRRPAGLTCSTMSAMCHYATSLRLFDHLVGAAGAAGTAMSSACMRWCAAISSSTGCCARSRPSLFESVTRSANRA
jgi:hypothetical protein